MHQNKLWISLELRLKLNTREKLKKLIYKKTRPNSQAPIPDKSSSTSSNVILTERRADVQLVTSQIQEDSRNSGGNKSSTIMTRSSSTKEKNN
ncbi:hypothetical protein GLOIN_2v1780081 [Rhizophagus irregularis DAOM 181602=DAOM 197198]|nr:hypothetical protein GLOIN_2v1780081 [Rhizophagus irregularis DAOM 181602=DAOM 197198]